MNEPDFQDWLKRHRAAFPSLDGDLERAAKGGTSVTEILRIWFAVLRDVSLADAIDATLRLARGDDEPPRRVDDHARVVRAVARRASGERLRFKKREPRIINGQYVYDCHLCSDTGMRTVWHSLAVAAMYEGKYVEAGNRGCTELTAVVACGCERGQAMMVRGDNGKLEPMQRFDSSRHLDYDPHDRERVQKLHDFAHRGPVAEAF